MSKLTLSEAIKHCLEVAEENDLAAGTYEILAENNHNAYERLTAETNSSRCAECAADHRQLAEWLTELKDLQEENKVLTRDCDRLIKEKGELLNKVSGGDVLRICQLEDRLQVELDNSHCLEIELAEAKRLLKAAVEDMKTLVRCDSVQDCLVCKYQLRDCDGFAFEWKHMEDVNKLINPIE